MKIKKLILVALLFTSLGLINCSKNDATTDCQTDPDKRRGAMCNDGTETTATGSGACSGHGGVDYWLCK